MEIPTISTSRNVLNVASSVVGYLIDNSLYMKPLRVVHFVLERAK